MNNIDVVYTMWENLKKTPGMEVGQVSFHRDKDVRKIRVEKRINETVNRLNRTKTEAHPGKKICMVFLFFLSRNHHKTYDSLRMWHFHQNKHLMLNF